GSTLGVGRAVRRWYAQFKTTGYVFPDEGTRHLVYGLVDYVSSYVKQHFLFYIKEHLAEMKARFPEQHQGLLATCVQRLRLFQLNLSRKILEMRAREAALWRWTRTWSS
ncbi:hypothetical protein PHYSODRAFT_496170, partial [Phytophthora sojae]